MAPPTTLAGHVAAKRDGTNRAIQGLFQRHHDVGFNVLAALGFFLVMIAETGAASPAAHRTEELFEEIAESCAAKMKLRIHGRLFASARTPPAPFPPRWRAKFRPSLPVRAELVVLFSFLRLAQNLIRLVDLFELFFGGLLPLGEVSGIHVTDGIDQVFKISTAFSAGFMKDSLSAVRTMVGPARASFGHPGAGGCHAFCDPENNLAFAYVMNQMEQSLLPNEKSLRVIDAIYDRL